MEFDEIGELQSRYSELSDIIKDIKLEVRNFDKNEESTELNEKRVKLLELYDELEDVQLKLKEHREKQIEFKRAEKTENAEQMERERVGSRVLASHRYSKQEMTYLYFFDGCHIF